MLPSDLRKIGLEAFNRRKIANWAVNHWENLGLRDLIGTTRDEDSFLLCFGGGDTRERLLTEALGFRVISFDIDPIEGVDMLADGHSLPLSNDFFNIVTAFEVLEHLKEPWIAIQEIARVLSREGRFVGSVAFLKPFHESYFHMSHKGVAALLESAGFRLDCIYGGQNVFVHIVGRMVPLGTRAISNKIYGALYKLVSKIRRNAWRFKTRLDPATSSDYYDDELRFSFDDFEKMKFGATIIFSATKK
jgi:ubiquinone/menaquinone biosynthesis C-methylase UbiE